MLFQYKRLGMRFANCGQYSVYIDSLEHTKLKIEKFLKV